MDSLHEIQQGHLISNCWYLFWSTRCSKSYHRLHPSCLAKPIGSMELVYLPIFWHNFDPNVGTYHTWILWGNIENTNPHLDQSFLPSKATFSSCLRKKKNLGPRLPKHLGWRFGRESLEVENWLVVEPTHGNLPQNKISQNGNLPQIGVKIKNVWNHHPENGWFFFFKR